MNSPAIDVKSILVAAWARRGSSAQGWEFHATLEPARPHTTVTVYDTGGWGPPVNMPLYNPTIEIRVRGNPESYQDAYAMAEWVRSALHSYGPVTVGGMRYLAIQQMGEITPLGYDESKRPAFSLNFQAHREPVGG